MKNLIILTTLTFLVSCANNKTEYSINSEKVFLFITQKTTQSELNDISKELLTKKNIIMDYSKSIFNKNNTINKLILNVNCNDGYKGIFKCSRKTLNYKRVGFIRNYNKTSSPFTIGKI